MDIMPRRLTVGRLMAIVAILAVVLGAELYRRANSDIDQATITLNLQRLRSDDVRLRRLGAEDLSRAETTNYGPLLAALAGAVLGDPDAATRREAIRSLRTTVLRSYGRRQRDWELARRTAMSSPTLAPPAPLDPLGTLDDEASSIRVVIRGIGDTDFGVRGAAVEALIWLEYAGPLAAGVDREAGPLVVRLLSESDPALRAVAAWCLAQVAAPPDETRGRLLALVARDPEASVRLAAIRALVKGWPSTELYPVFLARYHQATTSDEQSEIIRSLAGLPAPVPAAAVPALIRELDADIATRNTWRFPLFLAKLGPEARPYLGPLRELADKVVAWDDQHWTWFQVVEAMARIDPTAPEAQAMLAEVEQTRREQFPAPNGRHHPALILRAFGAAAAPLVPQWRSLLQSPDAAERNNAATWLGWIGLPAVGAIGDLDALNRTHPDPAVERALVQLRAIQPQ